MKMAILRFKVVEGHLLLCEREEKGAMEFQECGSRPENMEGPSTKPLRT